MKTKVYLLLAALAALTAVGCSKDDGAKDEGGTGTPAPVGKTYPIFVEGGPVAETRATWKNGSDGLYYWNANDRVGLTVTTTGGASVAHNLPMTNPTDNVLNTTFTGEFSQTQIDAMVSTNMYHYYSYFPYQANGGDVAYPNVRFSISSPITVYKDVFSDDYAPMVGDPVRYAVPITYLNGSQIVYPAQSAPIRFDYKHVMSFAAFEMDVNLLDQSISSVTITNNSNTTLSGDMNIDLTTGTIAGWDSPSNSITVTIDGGLDVGGGNILYIPVQPKDMSEETFTFKFNGTSTNHYKDITIPGTHFERGKIHKLTVAPPAEYYGAANFTTTQAGYYYIQAWGGKGGSGEGGAAGGDSPEIAGLYNLPAGQLVNIAVGSAGAGATAVGATGTSGGTNGSSFGNGGGGGGGGLQGNGNNSGGPGGGGGAGTFIFLGTQSEANIRLVSGGGGGSGGRAHSNSVRDGGTGGAGGAANGTGAGGAAGGGTNSSGTNTAGSAGAAGVGVANGGGAPGVKGTNGDTAAISGGGGGGGGGGGYTTGGGGGGGGNHSWIIPIRYAGGGGGGAGGASYLSGNVPNPGLTLPTGNNRTGNNGYVVITYVKAP